MSEDLNKKNSVEKKAKKSKKKRILIIVVALIIVVGGGAFYMQTQNEAYQQKRAEAKINSMLKKVERLVLLPEDEVPAVFDINEPETLIEQQAFFRGVEAGDKLLVFPETNKAIIYSPKKNQIINIGPVTFDSNLTGTPAAQPSAPTPQPATTPENEN